MVTFEQAVLVRDRHFPPETLLARGLVGTGIGGDGEGCCIRVYALDEQSAATVPSEVDGVKVIPVVTGEITAAGAS